MEAVEGAPCRVGLLDGALAYAYSLLVHRGGPSATAAAASPLVACVVALLCGPRRALLDLSPLGVLSAADSLSVIGGHGGAGNRRLNDPALLALLLALLSPDHLSALLLWPMYAGGNRRGVADVLGQVAAVLQVPFANAEQGPSEVPSTGAPSALAHFLGMLLEHHVPKLLVAAMEYVNAADCNMAMACMVKVLLMPDAAAAEKFAAQYIEAGGMQPAFMQKMLRESNPANVLVKTLLIISQLARMARSADDQQGANYDIIHSADMYTAIRKLFSHPDGGVRMRACNLVGNLCRHSAYFYRHLEAHDMLLPIIERCGDADSAARKFACFALGNAAFHNDSLYAKLAPGIAPLVQLLWDVETKTRVNAAGALGNLVRNGAQLIPAMIEAGAVQALMDVADGPVPDNNDRQPQVIALFSLGNMANHVELHRELQAAECHRKVSAMLQSDNADIRKNSARILNKLQHVSLQQA